MEKVSGVNPPVITIFDSMGDIDLEANYRHADYLIKSGVNGLAYLGTSGEFGVLTMEEKKYFLKHMVKHVNHRAKVWAGIGDTSEKNTLELLEYAESIGVDAILLITPYFSIYSEDMVISYVNKVAEKTSLPIIIYNFPELTGFNFQPSMIRCLIESNDNISGIKDTIVDLGHIKRMAEICKDYPDFTIFCAYESQALCALVGGADGFINATANFAPEYTVGLYQSYREGNLERAVSYQKKLFQVMDIYEYSTPLFLACKQAVYYRILGKDGGERLPGRTLSSEIKSKVKDFLINLQLIT